MKIHELKGVEQLDELNFRHAVAAAGLGAAMLSPHKASTPVVPYQRPTMIQPQAKIEEPPPPEPIDPKVQRAAENIADKYDVDVQLAIDIVKLAKKYQKPGFPTAKDILAIIAVESEFDPEAVSGLKHDPAVGLMQVRPKVWKLDPTMLRDPEASIQKGSEILHQYYRHLHGDKASAIQAYNVGMQNFQQGTEAPNYLFKFQRELKKLFNI